MKYQFLILSIVFALTGCQTSSVEEPNCIELSAFDNYTSRNFEMGFTSWNYDNTLQSVKSTYLYLKNHADIYVEQFDDKLPWSAWMNNTELPQEFITNVKGKVERRISENRLILSVSLLNTLRNNLIEDYNGKAPEFKSLNNQLIVDAYQKHIDYLIGQLNPDYVILAMETNELLINSPDLWDGYLSLISIVKTYLKIKYPEIQFTESVTLHNLYKNDLNEQKKQELKNYINQLDFIAISFYPFFNGLSGNDDFQKAFDFLNEYAQKPITFVETGHLAENLSVPEYNFYVTSNECEQMEYLETLLFNAFNNNYKFIIWWTHHDFDQLLEYFPDEIKPLGKIWRDTGLIDEKGKSRISETLWNKVFAISEN